MSNWMTLLILPFAVTMTSCTDNNPVSAPDESANAFMSQHGTGGERYIIRVADSSRMGSVKRAVTERGGKITREYSATIYGFVAEIDRQAAEAVRDVQGVLFVAKDLGVRAFSVPTALDRIDSRARATDGTFMRYFSGSGVRIYVLGSGVYSSHFEFGSRVIEGHSVESIYSPYDDHSGHETGVASLAAGTSLGVAPGAYIVPVRFDFPDNGPPPGTGEAWLGDMIAAVDYVKANYKAPAVAVMSWGVPLWVDNLVVGSLEDAVKAAISAGIMFVTAAGNEQGDACDVVPARVSAALTVAATYQDSDAFASFFSNYGGCVDLFAPGVDIRVAFSSGPTTYAINPWGTSLSAPYVAGTVAQLLEQDPTASPARIHTVINASATPGVVSGLPSGTPNRFVYSLFSHSLIDGPSGMYEPGNYTWSVRSWGGTGSPSSYTYEWHRLDGSVWSAWGTGIERTVYMPEGECENFALRATFNNGVELQQPVRVITPRIELCPL